MNTRQASRPCMIPWVQVVPGSISRGAIQHLIPADSRCAQIASAVARSLLEWLMKTTDGMLPPRCEHLTRFGLRWLTEKSPSIRRHARGHRFLGPPTSEDAVLYWLSGRTVGRKATVERIEEF